MEEDKGSFIDTLKGALFVITLFAALPAGVFLIVFGNVKTAELNKAEKVTVTFTEPAASVTLKSEYRKTGALQTGKTEEKRVYYYEIRVPYEYGGKSHVYRFKKDRTDGGAAPEAGDLITFTQTFTKAEEPVRDSGTLLFIIGVILLFLFTPVALFLVRVRLKERKERKENGGGTTKEPQHRSGEE